MPPHSMSEPDPSKPVSSATGVFRGQADDSSFAADFADLASRFAAQSGGGLSPELSADLALEIILNEVVEQACLATGATGAAIALPRGDEMVCRASSGATAPELGSRLDSASGLSGECIRTCRTQHCDDVLADLRVDVEASQRLGVRSVMVMPILREGQLAGVFELFSSLPNAFGERDERTLEALAGRVLSSLALSHAGTNDSPVPVEPQEALVEATPAFEPSIVSEMGPVSGQFSSSVSETVREVIAENAEISPPRGFDFLTAALAVAVVACAVLLGISLGRHLGFKKVANRTSSQVVEPTTTSEKVEPAPVTPVFDKAGPLVSRHSSSAKADGDTIPAGSLLVYENGKEVFRQSPLDSEVRRKPLTEGRLTLGKGVSGSLASRQGSGLQTAASVEPTGFGSAEGGTAAGEASVMHRVEPEYPENARKMQLQGPVVLDLRISETGEVQEITLVLGQPLLVQAAKDAVRQWRFRPRVVNGHAVTMQTRVTLNFRLPEKSAAERSFSIQSN